MTVPASENPTSTATPKYFRDFCRAMLSISAAAAVVRCPSVRLSVTFVYSVKINKHIFLIFLPSGSHTVLVFIERQHNDARY